MKFFSFLSRKKLIREPRTWREAAASSALPSTGVTNKRETEHERLEKYKKLGFTHVKISTSMDQRVCQDCKKHENKRYRIDRAPIIPMCEKCRCFYSPEIK